MLAQSRGTSDGRHGAYRAAITCYNGQAVHTLAGGQSLLVTDITPVVGGGKQDAASYRPGVSVVQQGVALQLTPLTTKSGNYVALDIHSRISELCTNPAPNAARGASDNDRPADAAGQVVAALDRPVLMTDRLSTTLCVPVRRAMLVGGMTFQQSPRPDSPEP